MHSLLKNEEVIYMDNARKKLPVIALDHSLWDGNWMNRQHILSRLGERGWPVIYSNGAKFYNEISLLKPFGSVEKKDNVALYHSGFFLPRNYKFKTLDRLAIKQHCKDLKKKAGLKKGDDFIAFCFHPDFYPYVEELDAPYVMFHIYDAYQKLGTQRKRNSSHKLLEKSDLVTAASETMWDEVAGDSKATENIIYNGVDYQQFENPECYSHDIIDKISSFTGCKIGYVGAINLKIDFEMIYNLALKNIDKNFIFIGNILETQILKNEIASKFYRKCLSRSNIHFMGPIPKDMVPQALSLMDINSIFYTRNDQDWVQAGYPLKINEYLAVGRPVITSFMPVLKEHFESNIAICNTVNEWCKAIEDALQGKAVGTIQSRKKMAKSNDWAGRVNKLEKLMFQMIEE